MGLLDMIGVGSGGDQSQGQEQAPPQSSLGLLGRIQANYAPNVYMANQEAAKQRATYDAAMQTQGMAPQIAQALALNPQFFAAQQGSYLPQGPKVTPVQNSDGSQTLLQESNPGGGAGHGVSVSGIPITEPPGTTASPTGAAGGAGGGGAGQGQTAPPASSGPKNTLQGMPGSTAAIEERVNANIAAGVNPLDGLPDNYKNAAQAVLDGRMSLSEIKQTRTEHIAGTVRNIVLKADPNFDERTNESQSTYYKQYASGKATDIGGQVKSINKLAGHANEMADASLSMNNYGAGGVGPIAHKLNQVGNALNSTPQAGLKRAADLYNNELSTYVSGKGGSGVDERKERSAAFNPNATPQEMGNTLLTDIAFIRKQIEGNQQQRDALFKNPKQQQQFELASPQALQQLHEAEIKAHKLIGDFDSWSKSPEGGGGGGLPPGVTVKKVQ